jgi:hypothetical protein
MMTDDEDEDDAPSARKRTRRHNVAAIASPPPGRARAPGDASAGCVLSPAGAAAAHALSAARQRAPPRRAARNAPGDDGDADIFALPLPPFGAGATDASIDASVMLRAPLTSSDEVVRFATERLQPLALKAGQLLAGHAARAAALAAARAGANAGAEHITMRTLEVRERGFSCARYHRCCSIDAHHD